MQKMASRRRMSGRGAGLLPFLALVVLALLPVAIHAARTGRSPADTASATILVYHRFGAVSTNEMTVRTSVFASQLTFLRDKGYTIVSLRDVVNFMMGHGRLPPRAVAITADDGHRTVFTEMRPLVERYRIPATLFIYPSAISNAPYAMTWEQLKQLQATGLFDIESQTYWHPNFRVEKRRLSAGDYQKLVESQLTKSRDVLERRLGTHVDLLAWPFGIYDDQLIGAARQAGYVAAFTIERQQLSGHDNIMAIPRFIVTDGDVGNAFEALLTRRAPTRGTTRHSLRN
jgi:peptidoglycan/xylan/chitin deacetylase (PgdA/CDA1 family)